MQKERRKGSLPIDCKLYWFLLVPLGLAVQWLFKKSGVWCIWAVPFITWPRCRAAEWPSPPKIFSLLRLLQDFDRGEKLKRKTCRYQRPSGNKVISEFPLPSLTNLLHPQKEGVESSGSVHSAMWNHNGFLPRAVFQHHLFWEVPPRPLASKSHHIFWFHLLGVQWAQPPLGPHPHARGGRGLAQALSPSMCVSSCIPVQLSILLGRG